MSLCLQVPFKILQACSELAKSRNRMRASLAITSATALFTAAHDAGFIPGHHNNSSSSNQLNSLGVSLRQQLEQSGLLQQLPALLTVTAQQLEHTPTAAATNQESVNAGPSADDTVRAACRAWYVSEEGQSMSLLWLVSKVCKLVPDFLSSHAAGSLCLLPSARLAMGVLRHVSSKTAGQQQAAAAANSAANMELQLDRLSVTNSVSALSTAVDVVTHAMHVVVAADSARTAGSALRHAEEVLLSPYILQCVCFVTAIAALMPVVTQSCRQQPQVQQAQHQQVPDCSDDQCTHLSTCQVPQPIEKMLQQMGCSKEVALLGALDGCKSSLASGVAAGATSISTVCHTLGVFMGILKCAVNGLKHDGSARSAHGVIDSPAGAVLTALPAVLLQWAASIPNGNNFKFAQCCGLAVEAAGSALCYSMQANSLWQQQEEQQEEQQQNGASVPPAAYSIEASPASPPPWHIVSSVLPLLCQMLPRLVQLRRLTAGQVSAGQAESTVQPPSASTTAATVGAGCSAQGAQVSAEGQDSKAATQDLIPSMHAAVYLLDTLVDCVQLVRAGSKQR